MITPLTPLPLPPTRQDPINFAARADAFLAALPDFQIELNILASELDSIGSNATQSEINAAQSATDAQDAATAAGSFANYKGLWSSLTGALNKPASVKHNGKYWNLLNNLADVTASEPGVSGDWEESDIVRTIGAVFTGPIEVPAGATGNEVPRASEVALLAGAAFTGPITVPAGATGSQVPRSSEVVHMVGAETIAGVKTFSSKPLVPAGATGAEVPQAQEIFGKSQSWQTVTRTSGVTYTNSTGKPILVTAFGESNNVINALSGTVSGSVSVWSSWGASGTDLNITFTVPPGSTYAITALGVASYTVKEYR
jgi:hypothetical protein